MVVRRCDHTSRWSSRQVSSRAARRRCRTRGRAATARARRHVEYLAHHVPITCPSRARHVRLGPFGYDGNGHPRRRARTSTTVQRPGGRRRATPAAVPSTSAGDKPRAAWSTSSAKTATFGADDGIRTRYPHLGNAMKLVQAVTANVVAWCRVGPVVRCVHPVTSCRRALYQRGSHPVDAEAVRSDG
jgi:hypothetical protein